MDGGRVLFDTASRINDVALARIRKGIGRGGDILFSHKGTVGKLALVQIDSPPFVCSPQSTFWRTLDEERLDRTFLYAYMRSRTFRDQWTSRKGETDMADYVSLSAQREFLVSVPPIGEQRAIGAVLGALDDKIELSREMNRTLEATAQAVFKSWFVDLDEIPDDWRVTPVAEVQAGTKNATAAGPFGSKLTRRHYVEAGVPVIRGSNMGSGSTWFRDRDFVFVSPEYANTLESSWARPGDVLITQRGTLGQVALIPRPSRYERYILSQSQMKLSCRPGMPALYVFFALRQQEMAEYIIANAATSGVPHINLSFLRTLKLVVPPQPILDRFDQAVSPIAKQIRFNIEESENLAELRDALLPKLLSGEIYVRQAEKAVERVL